TRREASLGCGEPVEKPAWAAGNPSRSQPGLQGTRREASLGCRVTVERVAWAMCGTIVSVLHGLLP
ncbi:MAG: hypothetical protein QNK22_11290, partial [Xanthomonadales bacterium]|nr:hypothetical protein [Xanthomonadales bacterium]